MPRSRAGRVVRCPQCKCAMRVPKLTEAQLKMGRVIPCRAKLARRRKLDPEEAAYRAKESREQEGKTQELKAALESDAQLESNFANENKAGSPSEIDAQVEIADRGWERIVPPPAPPLDDLPDLQTPEPPKPKRRIVRPAVTPVVSNDSGFTPFISLQDPTEEVEEEKDWEERLRVANQDRKLFARFFAICLCLVAVLNVIPASLQWYHWTQLSDSAPLPRWIYIQMFIGAIYLLYAFFLVQIPDWSALRAVSVAMLLMAFVFGIISTGLLVGGHGTFSGFLGIPFALNREACIWCVAMLCVATLMSFWGGKESANWQRAEQLLQNILT